MKIKNKAFAVLVVGVFAFSIIGAPTAGAVTVAELQAQIQALLAQINALQAQINNSNPNQGLVDLMTTVQYSNGNQNAWITATIKGGAQNKQVYYWTLDLSCSEGVTVPAKGGTNDLCGARWNIYADELFDATRDYQALTVGAENRGDSDNPQVVLSLVAYNRNGVSIGGDKEGIPLGFTDNWPVPPPAGFKVIRPAGGDVLYPGERTSVVWNYSGSVAPYYLTLFNDGVKIMSIDLKGADCSSSNRTCTYRWTVPDHFWSSPEKSTEQIAITDANGRSAYSGFFNIANISNSAPVITSLDSTGLVVPGVRVVVNGRNFKQGSYVDLDGRQSVTPVYISANTIIFVVPGNITPGSHKVRVREKASDISSNAVTLNVEASQDGPSCSADSPNPIVGQPANFTAYGTGGSYAYWNTFEGNPASGSGTTFRTYFSSPGIKVVTLSANGRSAQCSVNVQAPASSASAGAPYLSY